MQKNKNKNKNKKIFIITAVVSSLFLGTIVYDTWCLLKDTSVKLYEYGKKRYKIPYRSENSSVGIMYDRPLLVFMFGGAGWLFPFHFGVAKCLQEMIDMSHKNIKCIGTSAGGAVATALICNIKIIKIYEMCQTWIGTLTPKKTPIHYIYSIFQMLFNSFHYTTLYTLFKNCFQDITEDKSNIFSKIIAPIENRLLLNVTIPDKNIPWYKCYFIHSFNNFHTLLQCLCATCYIPILGGFKRWSSHKISFMIDGWFSNEFSNIYKTNPNFLNYQESNTCICYIRASSNLKNTDDNNYNEKNHYFLQDDWCIEPCINIPLIYFVKPNSRHIQSLLFTLGYLQAQCFIYRISKYSYFKEYLLPNASLLNEASIIPIKKAIIKTQNEIISLCNLTKELGTSGSIISS